MSLSSSVKSVILDGQLYCGEFFFQEGRWEEVVDACKIVNIF